MSRTPREPSARSAYGLSATSAYGLSGLLAVAGALHFVATQTYARIVPRALPAPTALVYLSGAAELACAAGLAHPRTRRRAAYATAALFVAVFPANVQMALDADGRSAAYTAAVWARLPLQVPLVVWALAIARRPTGPGGESDPQAGRSRGTVPRAGEERAP